MDNFTHILLIIFISYFISSILFPERERVENFCFLGVAGDCGVKNTNITNTINTSITDIVKENAQSCGSTTGISQMMKVSGLKAKKITVSGLDQSSTDNFDFTCMQVAENKVELEKKLQESVKNDVEQKTSGYQFQPSEQTTITNALNAVSTNIKSKSISDCISNKFINQELTVADLEAEDEITVENLSQTAIMAGTSKCMQSNTDITKSIEDIQKIIDTKSSQTATGVDMFASITALGTAYITGFIIIIVCSSIVSIISSIGASGGFSKSSSSNSAQIPRPYYQPPQQYYQPPSYQPQFTKY